ncbi:peptidylprolyl isomerase FKBP-type [Planctopirus limnophila DSM 3776]|uniref:Peptidyl-prolyl cis-trans isomerase n=1 Tax=Planctopirus limnophila (strain ATCC 43296 / DSM 3776 / IFAM 1008 / Mu 290) TaxID=521674 RepID=D5STN7_PLAL2|nr:FKBP-type peptidyl-prolyl cis-trans isomerase [Planctopirus limnophila]ADG69066.1 peptidylprolyl isomerase FKBP-type [Planctopirus limnophila DSM 3776]
MASVVAGDMVTISYRGTLDDGSVFDESTPDEPLRFVAGGEEVIEGLTNAVIGMTVGEKKRIVIEPDQAYGDYDDELEQTVERSELPEDAEVGDQLTATSVEDDDEEFPVWVVELNETEAVLDANHPLAGETLIFEIELLGINEPEPS